MRTTLHPLLLLALATLPAPAVAPPPPGDPLPEGAAARLGSPRFRLDYPCYNCSPSPDGSLFAVPQNDGIRLLDTADSYGPEVSENLIAEALRPYPENLLIATKGGFERSGPGRWEANGRPDRLKRCCEA